MARKVVSKIASGWGYPTIQTGSSTPTFAHAIHYFHKSKVSLCKKWEFEGEVRNVRARDVVCQVCWRRVPKALANG